MYNILFTSEMSSCKLEPPNQSRKKIISPVTLREVAVGIFKGINPAHNIKTILDTHQQNKYF